MRDFQGKTAFVTGGASGAGLGQAKIFGAAGCRVVIADIRQEAIDAALVELRDSGVEVHGIRLDITDREAFAAAAEESVRVFGPVQLLFNTAGVSIFGPMERATYDDYDWIFGVNVGGVVNGMQTFVPRMIAHGQGGHIVNTASLGAFVANSGSGIYSASKFAVHGLSMAMRDALSGHGIGVSVLCPANIRSNIAESVKTRPAHLSNSGFDVDQREIEALHEIYSQGMDPEELARHVKDAIEQDLFYIIPYPEARPMLEAMFRQVIDALPPPDTDLEGQEKRAKAMARYIEARQKMDSERYGAGA
ncbi:SDR family NAD(P)-dependent oxidoreductase [Sphingosinicella terrae]|uniref:SDR family NAD(P)-dependent oxidoreductase n=1 Tax=Sphingosinicella terrae TaxID=2172047 RepID=UPI000E0CFAC5|nr:SDR family NAD(P)-dependent oxidoreductase [Sphingosinicella terrae]